MSETKETTVEAVEESAPRTLSEEVEAALSSSPTVALARAHAEIEGLSQRLTECVGVHKAIVSENYRLAEELLEARATIADLTLRLTDEGVIREGMRERLTAFEEALTRDGYAFDVKPKCMAGLYVRETIEQRVRQRLAEAR